MKIIPYRKFWLSLSSLLVIASIAVTATIGFRLSADFTEGSLFILEFIPANNLEEPVEIEEKGGETKIENLVSSIDQNQLRETLLNFPLTEEETLGSVEVKSTGTDTYSLRLKRLSEEQTNSFLSYIESEIGAFNVIQARNVSPTLANTFRLRAIQALIIASLIIVAYISFAFRKVSKGIESWKLGVAAILALIHDILIIVGIFVLLGFFYQVEIDALFVTALLSVMGFSVNDTIVVFDRLRENLYNKIRQETFEEVAEKSLQQTMARSVNTSLSTLLVMLPLLLLGSPELFYFILALVLGIIIGTYSSIFLATPLLCIIRKNK